MLEYWGCDPEAVVAVLYRFLLDREPGPDDLRYHAECLRANRITPPELVREFVRSDEFQGARGAPSGDVRLQIMDCEFVVPAGAGVIGELVSPEGYEAWVLPYFLEQCRPGMTVLDVGASWGIFSLPAARRVGESGKIFALEVSSKNCKVLLKSLKASGHISIRLWRCGRFSRSPNRGQRRC